MKSTISEYKESLERVDAEIDDLSDKLLNLKKEKTHLVECIREACSHPDEYRNTILIYRDTDPPCDHYNVLCEACGKLVEQYKIINGKRIDTEE